MTPSELFEQNKNIVYQVWHDHISHIKSAERSQEDVIQVGFIALWKSCLRYDPTREVKFVTYAYKSVYQNMMTFTVRQFRKGIPLVSLETPVKTSDTDDTIVLGDVMLSPFDHTSLVEVQTLIDLAAGELGEECSQIIDLMVQGYTQVEISQKLKVNKTKVNRIVTKFKKTFTKYIGE